MNAVPISQHLKVLFRLDLLRDRWIRTEAARRVCQNETDRLRDHIYHLENQLVISLVGNVIMIAVLAAIVLVDSIPLATKFVFLAFLVAGLYKAGECFSRIFPGS
jgi:hypothetical protein